ncbi:MAG: hypothetical protein AAF927_28210 [Bacteroidota bacterium]
MRSLLSRILLFLFCSALMLSAKAQYISAEQVFPVEGYSVFQMGYPLQVLPAGQGNFAFLEFWAEGKQGRRVANYYLQAYGINDYVEHWFKPVTNEGFEPMRITEMVKLEKCFAVIGKQYQAKSKGEQTVARFFGLEGKPFAAEPVQISNFSKIGRNQREWVVHSPKKKFMAWVGAEGEKTYLTIWGNYGGKQGEKIISLPYSEEKYEIQEVMINDEGEVFFLSSYNRSSSETKPLVLNKYVLSEERFLTSLITLDASKKTEMVKMAFNFEQDILIIGGLSGLGGTGLSNGAKVERGDISVITHIFCQRLENSKDELSIVADSVSSIPQKWIDYFAEKGGSNFSTAEIIVSREGISLLWEERYEAKKRYYCYALGILGIDSESGGVTWNRLIAKRQRDQNSDQFLSYVAGVNQGKLRLVYLSERGARGNLMCISIDMVSGERKDKILASNESAEYLIFPRSSSIVSGREMVLVGMGNPSQNNYKLITITF